MHIPLNTGSVFRKTIEAIETAKAQDASQFDLTGNYRITVFGAPYSDARKWCEELIKTGSPSEYGQNDRLFFYTTCAKCDTTCPRCAKHYGKNYVVGLVAV